MNLLILGIETNNGENMIKFTGTYDASMIAEIREIHAQAIENMPRIADIDVIINLNSRMRSNGGTARLNYGVGEVELNYRLHRDNPSHVISTYLHELAHVINRLDNGFNGVQSHGYEWKAVMRELGQSPDRCHKMDVSAYKNKQKRFDYKCGCTIHKVTTTKHNKILRGAGYRCRGCKQTLTR